MRIDSKKLKTFINISIAILFIGLFVFATIRYAPEITRLLKDPDKFKELLNSYGYKSVFVFIAFQIIQVVIAVIPGEVIQIAGGYIFGTILGSLYSIIGILLGTIIVFYIVRLIGYPLVKRFVSQKSIEKFNFLINSEKSEIAIFMLFLIPGIPKDALTYIAGLTPIKSLRFFVIITIARLPALIGSSYIGTSIQTRDYLVVGIISGVAIILFVIGVVFRNKIIAKLHKIIHKNKD